jgi:hypothetical protein
MNYLSMMSIKESVNQALERTAIFWIYNVSQNQVTIDKKIKVLIIRMDQVPLIDQSGLIL